MDLSPYKEVSASGEELTRINIRLSRTAHRKLSTMIPWGIRRNVVEAVLLLVLDAVEKHGVAVAGAIMDGHFSIRPNYPEAPHYGQANTAKDPFPGPDA
jgi:hypothetical protein